MNGLIQWNNSYSVGIDKLDRQHRELITLYNQLVEDVEGVNEESQPHSTLVSLHDYILYHFSAEERLMQLLNYPGYEEHKQKHEHFEEKLFRCTDQFIREGKPISVELLELLRDWIIDHLKNSDREYAEHMQSLAVAS